jgi:hypothetical protein
MFKANSQPDLFTFETQLLDNEQQEVKSVPTKKRNKATFDTEKCNNCPLKEKCNIFKTNGKYYFTHSDYLKNTRNNNINKIPK